MAVPSHSEFSTDILFLAAWLLAARKLKFLRVDVHGAIADFIFDDPKQLGESLEVEFVNGDPLVPVKELRAALDVLRGRLRTSGIALRDRGAR